MTLLKVSHLSRTFGAVHAVNDVSFELNAGTILGFIGPNGAGKSTTMRILATVDLPSSGQAVLDGIDVVEDPENARKLIGYMPDRYGVYSDMTVWEFLDFFARAYGLKGEARRKRIESVVEFSGLGALTGKMTSDLSKGMRQRVALGRTLLHDPRLLILDEPADGLDPRARIELRELLRALAAQGKAVLISSHILTELSEICDACLIIEQGNLLAQGSVEMVLSQGPGGRTAEWSVRVWPETVDALEAVVRTALEQPRVKSASVTVSGVRVVAEAEANADDKWAEACGAALLGALLRAGHPVCAFEPRRADLEDAFLNVTQGRVQ